MKNVIVSIVFILFITNVKAQDTGTGMPKELTCTEKAFNVSFSVGQRLKLSTPKMGPVEAASYQTDYMPVWALKTNAIKPEISLPPSFQPKIFKVIDRPAGLFPSVSFNPVVGYSILGYMSLKPLSYYTVSANKFPVL